MTESEFTEIPDLAERRYRALFEASRDMVVVISQDGVVLDLNSAGCASLGYARREVVGQHISLLLDAEHLRSTPLNDLREVAAAGPLLSERTLRCKNGSLLTAEVIASPMPDGNILAVARDLSERRQHDSMLAGIAHGVSAQLGGAYFRALVRHLARQLKADYVFVASTSSDSAATARMHAFHALGKSVPPYEYRLEGSPCANALRLRGTVIYPEGVAQRFPADAGLIRLNVEGYIGTSLADSDGNPVGILVAMSRGRIARPTVWASVLQIFASRAAAELARDRAEQRLRELNASLEHKVRARTEQIESFSYTISHDLRAPLREILWRTEELGMPGSAELSTDLRQRIDRIRLAAERMARMIDGVLALARIGRDALVPQRVDMRAIVDDVIFMLSTPETARAEIVIADLPEAMGEPMLLAQVWQNLIGNALKFTRNAAAPKIEIGGRRERGRVIYWIRDNGAGFDMKYRDQLFHPFQRLHSSREFEGEGAGLAIVQRIVRHHGGKVCGEGAPGKGATFRFRLPLDAAAPHAGEPPLAALG